MTNSETTNKFCPDISHKKGTNLLSKTGLRFLEYKNEVHQGIKADKSSLNKEERREKPLLIMKFRPKTES